MQLREGAEPNAAYLTIVFSAAEEDIGQNTTLAFRAPEMVDLFRKQLVNHKVDVWAIGCMVFRMAFGYIPFEGSYHLTSLEC